MSLPPATFTGATVVITHQVRAGQESAYEKWLEAIGPICRAAPGHLDVQIIRPIRAVTTTYTVVLRFDTEEHLRQWMQSADRQQLIDMVRPSLAADDDYTIRSGLDFWFNPPGSSAKVPVRWKQALLTWSAIYPLVLGVPTVLIPFLRTIGVPDNRFLMTLLVTGAVVALMVYIIMPRYTRLVRHWLFE